MTKEGMRMKKLAIMTLSIVLISVMAIGGSLAYFTDTVISANNVITVGSVQVRQLELQRRDGVAYNGLVQEGDLIPFVQQQEMYPAYVDTVDAYTISAANTFQWGGYVTNQSAANSLWNDALLQGVIDKFVFVENIGTSPAYCRTLIAFECPDDVEYGTAYSDTVDIVLNLNTDGIQWTDLDEKIVVDGTQYLVKVATYTDTVKAKETSMPSLLQVVMTDNASNREAQAMGDTYEILVMTQACQTTTFIDAEGVADEDKATNALNTCFAEISEVSATEWFNAVLHPETAADNEITANTQSDATAQNSTPTQELQ